MIDRNGRTPEYGSGPTDRHDRHAKNVRFMALLGPMTRDLSTFCRAMSARNGRCDDEEARDLMSSTVLSALEGFDKLRDEQAFKSYLFTIARRTAARNRLRRRFEPIETAEAESIDAHQDEHVDLHHLYEALEQLPKRMREAVVLFELVGLSLEEVRQAQGGSLSGVKSRVARGRERLARLMGEGERQRPSTPATGSAGSEAPSMQRLIYQARGRI